MKDSPRIDRRAFLGGALAMAATTALPALALTGCASQSTTPQASSSAKSLTEEERALATTDPSYMGGSTNYAGQEVVIGVGKDGQIANQRMIDRAKLWEPALIKVTDRIYVSIGNCLANSAMIIGDTGIIIVDTSETEETAKLDLEQFRTVTDKPVVAVIYSHNHYTGGTSAYLPKDNLENVPIIAHERFMEALISPLTETAPFYVDRAYMQFGTYLPWDGEDGCVFGGVGPFFNNPYIETHTPGFIAPNTLIPASEHMVEMNIDGLTFQFFPTISDSFDNINIYVAEENAIISNQVWGSFYNMYTLRGEAYRDPRLSLPAIDNLLALEAEHFLTVHGQPINGKENVQNEITLYRDCIQFVYDQTIRYMNKGYDPDQIVASVKIPASMVEGFYTAPSYGEIEHFIRGVYRGLVGWFANDPLELHPVSKTFESAYIVENAGGVDAVVAEAKRVLEDRQYAWAATLANHALNVVGDHGEAKAVKAEAYRKMAQVSEATITRSWLMSCALDLEGKIDKSLAPEQITKDKLMAAPRTLVLDMLRVSIDPEKAAGMNESLTITYVDEGVSNSMVIRNCIGCVVAGEVADPSVKIELNYPTMIDVALKTATLAECIERGDAVIAGDQTVLEAMMGVCDMKL